MPLPNNVTTRLPSGVTNVAPGSIFANFPSPITVPVFTYFNDFTSYVAGDWIVTETDSGATEALTAGSGGWLLLTNTGTDDDLVALQKTPAIFTLSASKQLWFTARFKVSKAVQSDLVMGLQVVDDSPLDVTDGIYFLKSDGSASVSIVSRKDATTGSTSATGVTTLAADTFVTLSYYYDGEGKLYYGVGDTPSGSLTITNYFPDTILTVSFALQNGEAGVQTMTVDYIGAWLER